MTTTPGFALLVELPMPATPASHGSMAFLGETLLSSRPALEVHRLAPELPALPGLDCAEVKRHIDTFADRAGDTGVLIVSAGLAETPDGPALVVGPHWREYPRESTVPLAWLGERLETARASTLVVVLALAPVRDEPARDQTLPSEAATHRDVPWPELMRTLSKTRPLSRSVHEKSDKARPRERPLHGITSDSHRVHRRERAGRTRPASRGPAGSGYPLPGSLARPRQDRRARCREASRGPPGPARPLPGSLARPARVGRRTSGNVWPGCSGKAAQERGASATRRRARGRDRGYRRHTVMNARSSSRAPRPHRHERQVELEGTAATPSLTPGRDRGYRRHAPANARSGA